MGDWEARLRPEVGGCLAALRWRGTDVLRTMPPGSSDPLDSSAFALAPYCNRIREGRFRFAGREIAMPPNHPPERHSLHGLSWQRPWQTVELARDHALLRDSYDGAGPWPWRYRIEQRIALHGDGCTIALALMNESPEPMPAGLGFHPYFRRRPETKVRFQAISVLLTDGEVLPLGEPVDGDYFASWSSGDLLPGTLVDNCHLGWNGKAEIEDDDGRIAVSAEGAAHLHVYAPAGGDFLCLEPVTHRPNPFTGIGGGMTVLDPGGTLSMRVRIGADRAPE